MNANFWMARVYIGFSALAFLWVSLMAMVSPQSVMDLVHVHLGNPDAISSIRGVYGGVGLSIVAGLIFCFFRDLKQGVVLLGMIWGFYALSRLITHWAEGPLGDFGRQWVVTEAVLFFLALFILYRFPRTSHVA